MSDVIKFPFINLFDQKISSITKEMLTAIIDAQSDQKYFFNIVNKCSHIFQHRQYIEDPHWYDFIKVYVGVSLNDTIVAGINENDKLDEGIVAIPFGLLTDVAEISDKSIPLSIPVDLAATLKGDDVKRGLMYEWLHTDTEELLKEILSIWSSIVADPYEGPFEMLDVMKLMENPQEYTAILTEYAALKLIEKKSQENKQMILMSALKITRMFAENEDNIVEISDDIDQQEKLEELAQQYKEFNLFDFYEWVSSEFKCGGLFGGFDGFVSFCKKTITDMDFMLEEENEYLWLQTIFLQTDQENMSNY